METGTGRFDLWLKRRLKLAAFTLVLERLWIASRFFLCALLLFFAGTFAGLWEQLPPALHLLGLAAFAGLAGYGYYRLWRDFHWPEEAEILRFLESRNDLRHRPIRALKETLPEASQSEAATESLWKAHRGRLMDQMRSARIGLPRFGLGEGDRFGLRAASILLLVAGFVMAGDYRKERLVSAFTPDFPTYADLVELDIWITPPDYTGKAPFLLQKEQGEAEVVGHREILVPIGSTLIARVSGGDEEQPVLHLSGREQPFTQVEGTNFELETTLETDGVLAIWKDGEELGGWQIMIRPDAVPAVKFQALPEITERLAFRLQYSAFDDYGLASLQGRMIRKGQQEEVFVKLPLAAGATEAKGKSYHDLTAHPWAGFEVDLTLVAEDAIGQKGYSDTVSFTLPERNFSHPIARALIELRKKLVADPVANKREVIVALSAISQLHESLNNDFTAMMMLSMARGTLAYGMGQEPVDEVIQVLWDTALRLENGDLSAAEIALREAERALMEALNRDASDAEIKKLVEDLKQAMNDFLQALAKSQENMPEQALQDPNVRQIDQQDLQNMLDRIDQFARTGARDAARQLLSQLQDMLENLRTARSMPMSPAQQQGQEMLRQLGEMMRQQQNLLDETFRRSQSGNRPEGGERSGQQPGEQGQQSRQGQGLSGLSGRQEALRQMLGEMMGKLGLNGEIPAPFGKAERSMNQARQSLEQGNGQGAMESEGQALEQLREAAEGLAQQMMQGSGGQMAAPGRQGGPGRDPLGRPLGNGDGHSTQDMKIEGNALSRARQIQEELRRRLSDPTRDSLELDYLRRLMERFQ